MSRAKYSGQVQLTLEYPNLGMTKSFVDTTGITDPNIWQVLVMYIGDIRGLAEELNAEIEVIDTVYAVLTLEKDLIYQLGQSPNIQYIEFPEVMSYIVNKSLPEICALNLSGPNSLFDVTGEGVIIGLIDSGIDYTHPDFINPDGTSRIVYLWDQTIPGNPPRPIDVTPEGIGGFGFGTLYTREQINEALSQPTEEERLAIVPSMDKVGHGTAVAGIAAGNGNLNAKNVGVAPESELIIVKVGQQGEDEPQNMMKGPRNTEIMLAGRFIVERAIEQQKPVVILIGFGINEGGHDGTATLERVIDENSLAGQTNIVVGTGNQGNKDSHTSGMIEQGETEKIEILVGEDTPYYLTTIWKDFIDDFEVVIRSPGGESTEPLTRIINNRAFVFGNTIVRVNFSEPLGGEQGEQILVILDSFDGTTIDSGIWSIDITGKNILNGKYDAWGTSIDPIARNPRFLKPTQGMTLTIPATASNVTSVAASGVVGSQIAPFSGAGYTRQGAVKPDIVAPGTYIVTTSNDPQNRYEPISGTSAAAAFVTGAYALLLEYGLKQNPRNLIYGDQLKAYLLRNATRNPINAPYPNPEWGYGQLCIRAVLEELRVKYSEG